MFSILKCGRTILSVKFRSVSFFEMPYYAVAVGRKIGIFDNWAECETQVKGFTGAKFKKFGSRNDAKDFILQAADDSCSQKTKKKSWPSKQLNDVTTCTQKKNVSSHESQDNLFDSSEEFDNEIMNLMDNLENGKIIVNTINKKPYSQKKTILIDQIPPDRGPSKRKGGDNGNECVCKRNKTDTLLRDETFVVDESDYVVVYTDGACSRNGTKNARAGLGVYFGEDHPLNVSEPVSGRATNNCGEIQAATKAIRIASSKGVKKLAIYTDSKFTINSVTKWFPGWKRKGWKLASGEPVKNIIDFKDLDNALKLLEVKWVYVKAHKGILGNERADQLAKEGAAMYKNK